jgi:hypothetical protein
MLKRRTEQKTDTIKLIQVFPKTVGSASSCRFFAIAADGRSQHVTCGKPSRTPPQTNAAVVIKEIENRN